MAKVLIVSDTWRPEINGLVTALENLKANLEKAGHEVIVVSPRLFKSMPLFFRPELRLALFRGRKMRQIFDQVQPDYIHIVSEGSLGLAARKICLRRGLKFTTSYHTNFAYYIQMILGIYRPVNAYLRWFHGPAERVMVATENMRSSLLAIGFKNLAIWPLGVDTEFFKRNSAAVLPDGLERPVFMYFGRVAIEKSPEDFLKCDLPGSKIVIGDGPLRAELEKKYPAVKFFGYQTGQALVDLLSISDVCVFPSRTETFGLAILEALACEVPVCAYNVTGPKDIITPGKDGWLGDDLAAGAIKCLDLKKEDCRNKAIQFSWQDSARQFFEKLVKAR